ncbi:MAG TPA: hypothetical protein VGK99_07595 [Acidobacteriota bacterium]
MMPLLAIFGAGLLLRLWLIWLSPAIYGGDPILRLVYHDRLLLAYQLPLFQMLIYAVAWISRDPFWIRVMVSVIGALAGVFFYLLSRELLPPPAAAIAAILFVCNPYLLHFSIVPYQEMAMLLFLLAGVYFYWRGKVLPASALLALACLTRYEAWIVAAVCAVDYALQPRFSGVETRHAASELRRDMSRLYKAMILFLWAPLVWIACWHGLSPSGTFVLAGSLSWGRLYRLIAVSRAVASGLGWLLIPFFVLGLAVSLGRISPQWPEPAAAARRPALFLLLLALLFSISILFSAHGVDPDPERWVTFREGHLPVVVALLFTGAGVNRTILWSRRNFWVASSLVLLLSGYSLVRAQQWVQRSARQPALELDLQAARFIEPFLQRGELVAVLARPVPEVEIEKYLNQAERTGGETGLKRAREILRSLNPGPEDYQRLLAYTGADRDLLIQGTAIGNSRPKLILVFSDADSQAMKAMTPLLSQQYEPPHFLEAYPKRVAIYQQHH